MQAGHALRLMAEAAAIQSQATPSSRKRRSCSRGQRHVGAPAQSLVGMRISICWPRDAGPRKVCLLQWLSSIVLQLMPGIAV